MGKFLIVIKICQIRKCVIFLGSTKTESVRYIGTKGVEKYEIYVY